MLTLRREPCFGYLVIEGSADSSRFQIEANKPHVFRIYTKQNLIT